MQTFLAWNVSMNHIYILNSKITILNSCDRIFMKTPRKASLHRFSVNLLFFNEYFFFFNVQIVYFTICTHFGSPCYLYKMNNSLKINSAEFWIILRIHCSHDNIIIMKISNNIKKKFYKTFVRFYIDNIIRYN